MKRRVVTGMAMGAVLGWVILATTGSLGQGWGLGAGFVAVARADTFQDRKQAYLIDVEREAGLLAQYVGKLSNLHPTKDGANPAFASAKQEFDAKMTVLRAKIAALQAAPAQEAQPEMDAVALALAELRTAYAGITSIAK